MRQSSDSKQAVAFIPAQVFFATVCLCTVLSCSARPLKVDEYPKRMESDMYALTELDYIGWGLAEAVASANSERFGAFFEEEQLRETFTRSVVRVGSWTALGPGDSRYSIQAGSGVMVGQGGSVFLITAAHVLGGQQTEAIRRCLVTTSTGVRAEMLPRKEQIRGRDLAAVECKAEFATKLEDSIGSSIPNVRRPRSGEPVVVVGYPGGNAGVTPQGGVRYSSPQSEAELAPIFTFAEVVQSDPLTLKFAVGMVPMEGMSGSPVFGEDGALLGVFVRLMKSSSDGERFRIRAGCELLYDVPQLLQ